MSQCPEISRESIVRSNLREIYNFALRVGNNSKFAAGVASTSYPQSISLKSPSDASSVTAQWKTSAQYLAREYLDQEIEWGRTVEEVARPPYLLVVPEADQDDLRAMHSVLHVRPDCAVDLRYFGALPIGELARVVGTTVELVTRALQVEGSRLSRRLPQSAAKLLLPILSGDREPEWPSFPVPVEVIDAIAEEFYRPPWLRAVRRARRDRRRRRRARRRDARREFR